MITKTIKEENLKQVKSNKKTKNVKENKNSNKLERSSNVSYVQNKDTENVKLDIDKNIDKLQIEAPEKSNNQIENKNKSINNEHYKNENIEIKTNKNKKDENKIKRLLNKPDIRYSGVFSYRSLKIAGFLLLIFSQIGIIYNGIISLNISLPSWSGKFVEVIQTMSYFSLPMFLASNLCVIMSNKKKIKQNLIFYSAMALLFYLAIIFIYYRYIYGLVSVISEDPEGVPVISDVIAKGLFGNLINYNVFVDLSLFSLFYFFLFYTPKNINTKKKTIIFRSLSAIPVVFAITSAILYMLYYLEIVQLPVAILAILPCRSLAIYAVFIILSILIKIRQNKFIKLGETEKQYENYLSTKRNSLEVSVLASIVLFGVCLIDFLLLIIYPPVLLTGIGSSFYMVAIIPFIFLLNYRKSPKYKFIDMLIPVIFIVLVILLYLEAGLFIIKNIQ